MHNLEERKPFWMKFAAFMTMMMCMYMCSMCMCFAAFRSEKTSKPLFSAR